MSDLGLALRAYLAAYRWRTIDPVPWSPLRKPLREANVALVSTAGMVLPEQQPFDNDRRGGDVSFREIPSDAGASTLIDTHRSRSFDHAGIRADPNLGFPIDRLRELADEGMIGRLNHRHLSFMGSITAPGRLTRDTAPAAAQLLVDDGVEVVLLVPV
jgi:D-proline reductase (dithiol) PrdB